MAHLPREVEHDVGADRGVADVGPVGRGEVGLDHRDAKVGLGDAPAVGDQVGGVGTVARDARVDHGDVARRPAPAPARGWIR